MTLESGQREVYLSDFPTAKQKWQISNGDVQGFARWAPTGDTIYYETSKGVARVAVSFSGTDLRLDVPGLMLDEDLSDFRGGFFLLPSGQVLTLKATADAGEEPIRIIRNWEGTLEE